MSIYQIIKRVDKSVEEKLARAFNVQLLMTIQGALNLILLAVRLRDPLVSNSLK